MRLFESARSYRLALRAGFILVGGCGAFFSSLLMEEQCYWWAAVPALLVLLASLGEFVMADIWTASRYPTSTSKVLEKLEKDLKTYQEKIKKSVELGIARLKGCDCSQVSGTFHLKVHLFSTTGDGHEDALVQVTDYSGPRGGSKWRFTPGTKGLIGRCLRTTLPEAVNFVSEQEYRDRMVREFGFSPDEVQRHTRQARSYWVQPVFSHSNQFVGVIYLFSTEVQTFPLAVGDGLESVAREIAAFLDGAGIA